MVLCLYKLSYVLNMSLSHSKKALKAWKTMNNRAVVMPWDDLSVGASAADWWFCVYINLVMYWICQYLIVKNIENMEI